MFTLNGFSVINIFIARRRRYIGRLLSNQRQGGDVSEEGLGAAHCMHCGVKIVGLRSGSEQIHIIIDVLGRGSHLNEKGRGYHGE